MEVNPNVEAIMYADPPQAEQVKINEVEALENAIEEPAVIMVDTSKVDANQRPAQKDEMISFILNMQDKIKSSE